MSLSQIWSFIIHQKAILIFLLICNFLGTIYGYVWYLPQLFQSKWYFMLFIPDSPTATLFLCISLILLLVGTQSPLLDTLSFITLIKYGVWAVIMNIMMFIVDGEVTITGLMLICSHGIMALQAFIFLPRFKFTLFSIALTMVWVVHNDVIDYVFHQYPVYGSLVQYESIVGYIAFWLTVIPLLISIWIYYKRSAKTFDHT